MKLPRKHSFIGSVFASVAALPSNCATGEQVFDANGECCSSCFLPTRLSRYRNRGPIPGTKLRRPSRGGDLLARNAQPGSSRFKYR